MPEFPRPDNADAEDSLGVADMLQDAITELLGAEATLAQFDPPSEQRDALAAVRAALGQLRTVVQPDDWPQR